MSDSTQGGSDNLTGGNNSGGGTVINEFFSDAYQMSDTTLGGNDTLTGGSNSGGGTVSNYLYGDAEIMPGSAKGGNDILVAGTASSGGTVINNMWGDALYMAPTAVGGQDTFVFKDTAAATVGTQNFVEDFSQAQNDKIEFSDVANVSSFTDLVIRQVGADTVVQAGADQVLLVAYNDTLHPLTASDFVFA